MGSATGRKGGGGTLTFAGYSGSDYLLWFKSFNFATGEPSKVQVRDLVRVVGIVAPFPHGGMYQGKTRFIEPQGGKWAQETCAGAPSNSTPRANQAKFRNGTVWGLYNFLWLPGPRDQYLGKIRFIENLVYKTCVCVCGGGG